MNESEKLFMQLFNQRLENTLLSLDFRHYKLESGWMQPSLLYKHDKYNIWFGCSWDWRDFYFEADLGDLYSFKDVMPRVIVVGIKTEGTFSTNEIKEYLTRQFDNADEKIRDLANNDFENYFAIINEAPSGKINKMGKYLIGKIEDVNELPLVTMN